MQDPDRLAAVQVALQLLNLGLERLGSRGERLRVAPLERVEVRWIGGDWLGYDDAECAVR